MRMNYYIMFKKSLTPFVTCPRWAVRRDNCADGYTTTFVITSVEQVNLRYFHSATARRACGKERLGQEQQAGGSLLLLCMFTLSSLS